jgi:DNA-binding NarL/FixJ family response regulator
MTRPLRILLLEDRDADAELVRRELERGELEAVTEQVDSRDAFLRALRDFKPDVVLTDQALPQFDSAAALKAVRALRPVAPVILVAGALDERSVVASLRAGAEDLVLKSNLGRLVPAIRASLNVRQRLRTLSPRQLEVLRLVAEGHTTREVARALRLSAKTVETHRGEIMKRLAVHDVVALVRYAVRVGLVPSES